MQQQNVWFQEIKVTEHFEREGDYGKILKGEYEAIKQEFSDEWKDTKAFHGRGLEIFCNTGVKVPMK